LSRAHVHWLDLQRVFSSNSADTRLTFFAMSQHRSLQPTGPPPVVPGPHTVTRLNESFEAIRQEFEGLVSEAGLARSQRDEYEAKGSLFFSFSIFSCFSFVSQSAPK